MRTFGTVVRQLRQGLPRTQEEVADAGGLDQARISEIERDVYMPGLDLAARVAKGLDLSLTALVARWEGVSLGHAEIGAEIPDEALFRRVRGLWEDMAPDTRGRLYTEGRRLLREQWDSEEGGEAARPRRRAQRSRGARD